jgi:hypothetical protein
MRTQSETYHIFLHTPCLLLTAAQVILSMGEVMYIPGNWFHYIVSQDASIQCNARSGASHAANSDLGPECGL